MTMRTFHTGGVVGEDITQGLPRVEELFEARKPKGLAVISEIDGTVKLSETKKKREIIVSNDRGESKSYTIPYGSRIKVMDGDYVEAGDELTEGSVNPHDILKIKGVRGVQTYLLHEVQKVYRLQGVDINDKHIEVIIRQMLRRIKIEDAGDTNLLPGSLVDVFEYERENSSTAEKALRLADGKRSAGYYKGIPGYGFILISSFLPGNYKSLNGCCNKRKNGSLVGLKENVIIGKLIPAGTGMKRYSEIDVVSKNQ